VNRRALPVLLGIVLVALVITTLATGETLYTVPALILVALIAVMAVGEWGLKKRVERGDPQSDNTDPVPSTHLAKDEETPLGDTSEAHDEISPHDLPKDHPGRVEAEKQAGTR
jgi:membrane protein required for beta-lactamase induction